jgi:hypothetical protein
VEDEAVEQVFEQGPEGEAGDGGGAGHNPSLRIGGNGQGQKDCRRKRIDIKISEEGATA